MAGTVVSRRQGKEPALPDYSHQLSRFHRTFEPELTEILRGLPLTPAMNVLDLACGDGFYTRRIAALLGPSGTVTGVDVNFAYLAEARQRASCNAGRGTADFVAASFDCLPFANDSFDFVWCAQSLYSLPDPVLVLRRLARVVKPGGMVAILENDTMHQVILPWPVSLELPLRAAELQMLSEETLNPGKYYVGRRLPAVFAAAGFDPLKTETRAIDRQAPFGKDECELLQSYLEEVTERVAAFLEASLLKRLRELIDPESSQHMLRQPYLTMTWLNVLALGQKPMH